MDAVNHLKELVGGAKDITVEALRFDHNRKRGHAAGTGPGLDSHHLTRHAGMDGCAETIMMF